MLYTKNMSLFISYISLNSFIIPYVILTGIFISVYSDLPIDEYKSHDYAKSNYWGLVLILSSQIVCTMIIKMYIKRFSNAVNKFTDLHVLQPINYKYWIQYNQFEWIHLIFAYNEHVEAMLENIYYDDIIFDDTEDNDTTSILYNHDIYIPLEIWNIIVQYTLPFINSDHYYANQIKIITSNYISHESKTIDQTKIQTLSLMNLIP